MKRIKAIFPLRNDYRSLITRVADVFGSKRGNVYILSTAQNELGQVHAGLTCTQHDGLIIDIERVC